MLSKRLTFRVSLFMVTALAVGGCDFFRKNRCEWYMVPEPKHINLVEKGWVSICLRNYVLDRQRCYMKATLELSEKMYGKSFRLTDLEVDESVFPREIKSVEECVASD